MQTLVLGAVNRLVDAAVKVTAELPLKDRAAKKRDKKADEKTQSQLDNIARQQSQPVEGENEEVKVPINVPEAPPIT